MGSLRSQIARSLVLLRRLWRKVTGDWTPYVEAPLSEAEVLKVMQQASVPSFGFYLMLSLATAIASFGMLANSAPNFPNKARKIMMMAPT